MGLKVEINTSSYAMVADELAKTLQEATNVFETFLSERHELVLLEQCEANLRQIGGTLRLLQIPGAALLADEMRILCGVILKSVSAVPEGQLNALSTAFFVLPRYLEFVQTRQSDIPQLAISHVNELRTAHQQLLIPDSYFSIVDDSLFSRDSSLKLKSKLSNDIDISQNLKRINQLYQSGLLGLLRDAHNPMQLTIMSRAVRRLRNCIEPGPQQRFWLLADAVLDAFVNDGLELNPHRKRILAGLEGQIRARIKNRTALNDVLERELVFLLTVSAYREGSVGKVLKVANIKAAQINDDQLRSLRGIMLGLSYDTVSSVINELRTELRHAKDVLELLAQHQRSDSDELLPLTAVLKQSADILSILNLPALASTLNEHADALNNLIGSDLANERARLEDLAETLLFIDGSLAQIDRRKLNYEDLGEISLERRDEISADNQVSEARSIVIEESKAAIGLVKRAISAYIDSGFDSTHLANLPQLLNSVRGAFQMIGATKLPEVTLGATEFMSRFIARNAVNPAADVQALETLADAMISIEYYLNELSRRHIADERILHVAEDSVASLQAVN
ncbi:Uncharacterised protein [Zhongshania aliphaticivorans]|uniref:Scaffold protein FimL second domain-containing protein n=1 Tax=Zhongshania aliphaticivorans TaxID=1470434 RepID=A0A5S9NYA0_9GAMM|nr:Uncharacterised protein [Zhongshania aliphaticivorans]CAA0095777.1 Uncharacterised protein [Zhongshania aliphaticivorans]